MLEKLFLDSSTVKTLLDPTKFKIAQIPQI